MRPLAAVDGDYEDQEDEEEETSHGGEEVSQEESWRDEESRGEVVVES